MSPSRWALRDIDGTLRHDESGATAMWPLGTQSMNEPRSHRGRKSIAPKRNGYAGTTRVVIRAA